MSRGIISLDKFKIQEVLPWRTFTVNPDWGIKNLEKAIDNGSPTVKRLSTPEAKAKFKEATTITPEMEAKIKARYGK